MQQQIDLLLFLVSHFVLIYWVVRVFKYTGKKALALRLSYQNLIVLLIVEIFLFGIMYLNYHSFESPEIADSFAWHNYIVYARGIMPWAVLASLNDKLFEIENAVLLYLFTGILADYSVLFLATKVVDIIKKN